MLALDKHNELCTKRRESGDHIDDVIAIAASKGSKVLRTVVDQRASCGVKDALNEQFKLARSESNRLNW